MNNGKIYFKEIQKFTSPLLWLFLIIFFLFLAGIIVISVYNDHSFQNTSEGDITDYIIMAVGLLFVVGLIVLFLIVKLETLITEQLLIINFKPLLKKKILLEDIIGFEERRFNFIEYGGWGIRYSLFGHGWAYTVKGYRGVQFLTRNGKKFLLGSQKPDKIIFYLKMLSNSENKES